MNSFELMTNFVQFEVILDEIYKDAKAGTLCEECKLRPEFGENNPRVFFIDGVQVLQTDLAAVELPEGIDYKGIAFAAVEVGMISQEQYDLLE